jgi:hypothetical protein
LCIWCLWKSKDDKKERINTQTIILVHSILWTTSTPHSMWICPLCSGHAWYSKICIILVAILLEKLRLLCKLLELSYHISLVLHFVGPITWTNKCKWHHMSFKKTHPLWRDNQIKREPKVDKFVHNDIFNCYTLCIKKWRIKEQWSEDLSWTWQALAQPYRTKSWEDCLKTLSQSCTVVTGLADAIWQFQLLVFPTYDHLSKSLGLLVYFDMNLMYNKLLTWDIESLFHYINGLFYLCS